VLGHGAGDGVAARDLIAAPVLDAGWTAVVDPSDASPLAAAERELREETGHAGGQWSAAGQLAVNPATHTNLVHCFIVRGPSPVTAPQHNPSERISSTFVTLDTLHELIDSGDFGQALHVATLFLALRQLSTEHRSPSR
jgi:ADP-ribose pyrophosphatase